MVHQFFEFAAVCFSVYESREYDDTTGAVVTAEGYEPIGGYVRVVARCGATHVQAVALGR